MRVFIVQFITDIDGLFAAVSYIQLKTSGDNDLRAVSGVVSLVKIDEQRKLVIIDRRWSGHELPELSFTCYYAHHYEVTIANLIA